MVYLHCGFHEPGIRWRARGRVIADGSWKSDAGLASVLICLMVSVALRLYFTADTGGNSGIKKREIAVHQVELLRS